MEAGSITKAAAATILFHLLLLLLLLSRLLHPRRLPGLDLRPRPLVDRVVDRHHGLHVARARVVAFAPHRFEEHPFRWVDPVPGCGVRACFLFVIGWERRRAVGWRWLWYWRW